MTWSPDSGSCAGRATSPLTTRRITGLHLIRLARVNFEPRTKCINRLVPDDVLAMNQSVRVLASLAISMSIALLLIGGSEGQLADSSSAISYEIQDQCVRVSTQNMSIALSKTFPAMAVKAPGAVDADAYGFVLSSILAYNDTEDIGLVLETVPYHASLEHSEWILETPSVVEDEDTSTFHIEMSSSVTLNKRLASWDGNPTSGTPGIEKIENWATVTVEYEISTSAFSSSFEGSSDEEPYPVNGSTEMKFDLTLDINVPIDATRIALDIGLMKMEFGAFEATAMDEQYVLRGFQSDGVVVCDPEVNETIGDDLLLHTFNPRNQLKQMFEFVEDTEAAFFSWAAKTMSNTSEGERSLEDVTTYYRTDGEGLRLYLASGLSPEVARIEHDPSLGMFPVTQGYVDLPDDLLGSSSISTAVGILLGLAAAGGVSAVVMLRRSRHKDDVEVVVLERNRYYKQK